MNNFNFSVLEGTLNNNPSVVGETCFFTISCNRSYTRKDGTKVEDSYNFDIVTKGKLATTCFKYLKAGSRVLVSGALRKSDAKMCLGAREINFLSEATL